PGVAGSDPAEERQSGYQFFCTECPDERRGNYPDYSCRRSFRRNAATNRDQFQNWRDDPGLPDGVNPDGFFYKCDRTDRTRVGHSGADYGFGDPVRTGYRREPGVPSAVSWIGHWLWFQACPLDERCRVLDHCEN